MRLKIKPRHAAGFFALLLAGCVSIAPTEQGQTLDLVILEYQAAAIKAQKMREENDGLLAYAYGLQRHISELRAFVVDRFAGFESYEGRGVQVTNAAPSAPTMQLRMDNKLDSLRHAVYFEYASAKLNNTGMAAIEAMKDNANEADEITILGIADPSGNSKKNQNLALLRAASVRGEFIKHGVAVSNIKTSSVVSLVDVGARTAFLQNMPTDESAKSRRADVDMKIRANAVSKNSDSSFVFI